jgi:hypothetical protein
VVVVVVVVVVAVAVVLGRGVAAFVSRRWSSGSDVAAVV